MYELNTIDISGETPQVIGVKQYKIHPRIGEFIEIIIDEEKIIFVVVMLVHSLTRSACDIYISNAADIFIRNKTFTATRNKTVTAATEEIFRSTSENMAANVAGIAEIIEAAKASE